jgi:hypothetical protein
MISAITVACVSLLVCHDNLTSTYKYVTRDDALVGFYKLDEYVVGEFDRYGEFHCIRSHKLDEFRAVISHGPEHRELYLELLIGCDCYELRSDVLVPGTFSDKRLFVPDIDRKMIKWSDYKYSLKAPVIWNLPGKYVVDKEHGKPIDAKKK